MKASGTLVALRTCLGCGMVDSKWKMTRIVFRSDRGPLEDRAFRANGRGGYLHSTDACRTAFAARKGMIRSLGASLSKSQREAFVAELAADDRSKE